MKKRWIGVIAAALAVAALCLCVGCSGQQAQTQQAKKDYKPISVAYLNKVGYEDVIIADKQGYYKDCGPEVTLNVVTGSGQQSVEALLAGSVDIAATGKGPVGDAVAQYGDDIIILAGTNLSTGDQVWVAGPTLTGDAAITPYDKATDNKAAVKESFEKAAAALGGTVKCGVQKGATTESEFKSWLKAMDISFNDFGTEGTGIVTLIDAKANTLPTALASGSDINMMAASQPYPDTALSQISGSYKIGSNADTGSYGVATLITTKEIFAEKEDSIKAFLQAEKQACDFMNTNAEEAIKICADSMGTDVAAEKASFDTSNFACDLSDKKVSVLLSTCQKKGATDLIETQLRAQMPLIEWMNSELNK